MSSLKDWLSPLSADILKADPKEVAPALLEWLAGWQRGKAPFSHRTMRSAFPEATDAQHDALMEAWMVLEREGRIVRNWRADDGWMLSKRA